jgi:hypothetical protein
LRAAVDKHPCYTEAKTKSLNLGWSELRFCFGSAMMFLQGIILATPPVFGALMDQRRVGRLTIHWSERDDHKVLTHGLISRRSAQ